MGQMCSSYFHSSDVVHREDDVGVPQTEVVACDTTHNNAFTDNSITSHKQHSLSVSAKFVDIVRSTDNTSVSMSTVCTPTLAAVTSSQGKAQHQPGFFANMTEEHWERLNMMCIVSPSSS